MRLFGRDFVNSGLLFYHVLSLSTPVVNYYDTLDNIEFLSKTDPEKAKVGVQK